jgi:CheY-like chemotaxis protein
LALRCLLVDDNVPFLEAARGMLEREGLDVVAVASTSADALRRVDELRPDVILVDIDLGEESGFDLAIRLAGDAVAQPSQVILMSTYAEEDFAALIAASPAAGFVSKTEFSRRAILEVLRPTDDSGGVDRG